MAAALPSRGNDAETGRKRAAVHMLCGVMPAAKVDDMLDVLSIAGALLFDEDCSGLLNLIPPAGSA